MKKAVSVLVMLALAAAQALAQNQTGEPTGTFTYSLPVTTITLEVTAVQENFYAGPYARYAQKYLGTDAKEANSVSFKLKEITIKPRVEADLTARYSIAPGKAYPNFLALSSQGLISTGASVGADTDWRFPSAVESDFAGKGLSSALTSTSTTLYRKVNNNTVAVTQDMVVEKSTEAKAKEAAELIFSLRKKKVQIVTGDTDATYGGEAMRAALDEISQLEKDYMSLFIGYTVSQEQKMNFDVVPVKDTYRYVAFRLSDTEGLVGADNVGGKPFLLDIDAQQPSVPQGDKAGSKSVVWYRVPATCNIKVTDGSRTWLTTRLPIYQLGVLSSYPIIAK